MWHLVVLYLLMDISIFEGTELKNLTCSCGWRNRGRIIGGKETRKNEYPWMVAIMDIKTNWTQFCGGSIITPWHILTAAHCTIGHRVRDVGVIIGAHNVSDLKENTNELIPAQQIIEHKKYDDAKIINDIAIIITSRKIVFNKHIGPVCLLNRKLDLDGHLVKVTGWGLIKETSKPSPVLREVNVRVIPISRCNNDWRGMIQTNSPSQLCTYRENKDSCYQDSGGPVVWLDPETNRYTQVALVSFGGECGGKLAAVNTDVFAFIKWINKRISDSKLDTHICTAL